MATYDRFLLANSVNGRPIPLAAVASPGTALHTAASGVTGSDEVYLWVSNVTNATRLLTIEWGGTTDPADLICKQLSIPANSPPIPIATGLPLQNGLTVRAYADVANTLNVSGYANRIA